MGNNTKNTSKNMGRYYTPKRLAQILTKHAITSNSQTVLDPSCGYGSLLQAALGVLRNLGSKNPGKQLFGVDIDNKAIEYLRTGSDLSIPLQNLKCHDFMRLQEKDLNESPFDLVLCNPPYTRHHEIDETLLKAARDYVEKANIELPKTSAYWTYFILHSTSFLKIGGRMSMLLPLALLEASYSKKLQREIECRFEKIDIHILRPGYFEEIQEHVILMDAQEYQGHRVEFAGNVHTILNGLDGKGGETSSNPPSAEGWSLKSVLLPNSTLHALKLVASNSQVQTIGECFNVAIGVVTGANGFFILSSSEIRTLGLHENWFLPIVAHTPLLKGLGFTSGDYATARRNDEDVCMINTSEMRSIPSKLRDYLNSEEAESIRKGYHCRNRSPWHSMKRLDKPDAFFHYMASSLPHIVLNNSEATCTNTIHRLTKRSNTTKYRPKTLSLSSITSLSALSSEIEGRGLGGGLLKLEPSAVKKVLLAVPTEKVSDSVWKETDKLLRNREIESAMDNADREVLEGHLGIKKKVVKELRASYEILRDYRHSRRNSRKKK